MNKGEIDIELIEKYLDQELSEVEQSEFESKLQTEKGFQEDFDQVKLLIEGIRYSGSKSSIRSKIEHLEATLPDIELGAHNRFQMTRSQLLKYAATFTLILASAWLFREVLLKPDYEEIFAANFEPYLNTGSGIVRGAGEAMSPEQRAYASYDSDSFAQAVQQFEALLSEKDDAAMRLYLGNALLAMGEVESAKQQFRILLENNAGLIIQAKWYLSLCYLKNGELDQAQEILQELSNNGKSYRKRATKILEDL